MTSSLKLVLTLGADFSDIPMEDLSGDLFNVSPGGPYTITWDGLASFDDTYSEENVIGLHAKCILPDVPTSKPANGLNILTMYMQKATFWKLPADDAEMHRMLYFYKGKVIKVNSKVIERLPSHIRYLYYCSVQSGTNPETDLSG